MRFKIVNRKSEDEGVEESEPQEIPCQKCGVMFKAVDGTTMCAGCVGPKAEGKAVDLGTSPKIMMAESPMQQAPWFPSLCLNNEVAERFEEEFDVEPGDEFTFSGKAKCTSESESVGPDGRKWKSVCFDVMEVSSGQKSVSLQGKSAEDFQRKEVKGKKHVDLVAKRFTASSSMERKNVTGYRDVKDAAGDVVDYKDVAISGYLTTWKETTPKDRDGEYVIKGALGKSIAKFMENPVLLRDHKNLTENVAGSVKELVEDDTGVAFKAVLSNKPEMRGMRFDVVEGHLKAVSMGGAFLYDSRDSKGIKEVALYELTCCPIPSNPDALFTVSDLPAIERKFLEDGGTLEGLKAFHYKNVIDSAAT